MPHSTLACAICAQPLPPRAPGRPGRPKKYHNECDPHFRYTILSPRPCNRCGAEFKPKNRNNVFCSAYCKSHIAPHPERSCEFCGEHFRPVNTRQRFCSLAHARAAWKDANPDLDADFRRDAYHRRRARRKGSSSGAPVLRGEIVERDKWTCHICRERIPRSAKWPEPLSLSLDHVLPLSLGGMHDPSNVKAAHLRCNVDKGAALVA